VGRIKGDAIRKYAARQQRAHDEPTWCPVAERREIRARSYAEEEERKCRRVTFSTYAQTYLEYAKHHKNSWKSDVGRLAVCSKRFGERQLDEITPLEIEQFRDSLLDTRSRATSNRYRDLLSAVFKRAVRDRLVPTNPVRTVSKFKETGGRLSWLKHEEEAAVHDVLLPELRPLFATSVNTGLRWGEQIGLQWRDVDFLSGFITVRGASMAAPARCQ